MHLNKAGFLIARVQALEQISEAGDKLWLKYKKRPNVTEVIEW